MKITDLHTAGLLTSEICPFPSVQAEADTWHFLSESDQYVPVVLSVRLEPTIYNFRDLIDLLFSFAVLDVMCRDCKLYNLGEIYTGIARKATPYQTWQLEQIKLPFKRNVLHYTMHIINWKLINSYVSSYYIRTTLSS